MTKKISTFIGSFAMLVAIALLVPSTANATWGNLLNFSSYCSTSHGSHGSNNSSNSTCNTSNGSTSSNLSDIINTSCTNITECNTNNQTCTTCGKYKTLAENFLKRYYRCFNFSYYRNYCNYIKRYKICKNSHSTKTSHSSSVSNYTCNSYKRLADKYLALYNRCGYSCYNRYYNYYKNLYNRCHVETTPIGKICGQVFEDTNRNDQYDNSDRPFSNVKVKITDSTGKVTMARTNNRGYYCACNIAVGKATVKIIESTLPYAVAQVVGTKNTEVTVVENQKTVEERNGYVSYTPVGSICGTIYEDANANDIKDTNERGAAGIIITITDANGTERNVTTNNVGRYCLEGVSEGNATFEILTSTLPTDANITITSGSIIIEADKVNNIEIIGYTLPPVNPIPVHPVHPMPMPPMSPVHP